MVFDVNKCNRNNMYNHTLREQDFYPLSDNRAWKSNVKDIMGGDNFADFCEYFFEMLDEEEYFES